MLLSRLLLKLSSVCSELSITFQFIFLLPFIIVQWQKLFFQQRFFVSASVSSGIVQLSDAQSVQKPEKWTDEEAKANRQTSRRKRKKEKKLRVEEKCDCGFQQTVFRLLVASTQKANCWYHLLNSIALKSGFMQKCLESRAERIKASLEEESKSFLAFLATSELWKFMSFSFEWENETTMRYQGQKGIFHITRLRKLLGKFVC